MFDLNFTPAHLHLALNHIPIIGLAVASFPIVIGILTRCKTTLATGLLATILCAAAMPTIMETGSAAGHALRDGTLLPALDEAGKAALHLHANHAKKMTPIVYASAILAVLGLLMLVKFTKPATWLAFAVLLGNGISILLAIWTAEAGGRIRHLEFRPKVILEQPAEGISPPLGEPLPNTPEPAASPTPAAH